MFSVVMAALLAVASAANTYSNPHGGAPHVAPHAVPAAPAPHGSGGAHFYGASSQFRGVYQGRCWSDGVYVHDAQGLILCSNHIAYYQPCPPGTQNSMYGGAGTSSQNQGYYNLATYCDVNLVGEGYGPYGPANTGYGNQHASGYGGGVVHGNNIHGSNIHGNLGYVPSGNSHIGGY